VAETTAARRLPSLARLPQPGCPIPSGRRLPLPPNAALRSIASAAPLTLGDADDPRLHPFPRPPDVALASIHPARRCPFASVDA